MLEWYDPLYVGDGVRRYVRKIKKRISSGRTDVGHYLITLAANGTDELDIISTTFLEQKILRDHLPMIVGIAADRKEAIGLAVRITSDCLESTGDVHIREWLLDNTKNSRR